MPIKNDLLSRLRRTHMPIARRVRLLDEPLLSPLSNDDGELNPPQRENRQVVQNMALKFLERSSINSSFMYDSSIPCALTMQEKIIPILKISSALASTPPGDMDGDSNSITQFNNVKKFETVDIDSLPRLAMIAANLTMQNKFPLKNTQEYLSKVEKCFSAANKIFDEFERGLCEHFDINSTHGFGFSIVSISIDKHERLEERVVKQILNIPQDNELLILGNKFVNGCAPIYSATEAIKSWGLEGAPLGAEIVFNSNPEIKFNDVDTSAADSLLNQFSTPGGKNAMTILKEHWNTLAPSETFAFEVEPLDLDIFSIIHKESGVCGLSSKNQQLNCFINIKSDDRWFVDTIGGRKLTTIKNINTGSAVKIRATPDSQSSITLTPNVIQSVIESGELNLKINSETTEDWVITKSYNSRPQSLFLPNPALNSIKKSGKEHLENHAKGGYIDKQYSSSKLQEIMSKQGFDDTLALSNGLDETLYLLNATTLASFDIHSTGLVNGNPYYINLTLYSQTQKGPHIRRAACCIHNEGWILPTDSQLENLGFDKDTFLAAALSTKEAEEHLLKPLNKNNRFALSFHNSNDSLSAIKKSFPTLSNKIKYWPMLDRQMLIKQERLGLRRDPSITLNLGSNNSRPILFMDMPGNPDGLRQKLREKKGQCLSSDSSASLVITESDVVLHDHKNGVSGSVGTPNDLVVKLHTNQKTPNVQQASGDPFELAKHHRVKKLLSSFEKNLPPAKTVDMVNLDSLPQKTIEGNVDNEVKIKKLWQSMQPNINFENSAEDNLESFKAPLNEMGLDLDTVIAGGVGGKKGRDFLLSLHNENRTLFTLATAGKKLDFTKLLKSGSDYKVNAPQASLTLRDILLGSINRLQKANSQRVSHYQLVNSSVDILSRLEPTTAKVEMKSVEALAKSMGLPTNSVARVYKLAYQEKKIDGRSYQQFLPSLGDWNPMGDQNILEHAILFDSLFDKYGGYSQLKPIIENQNIKLMIHNQLAHHEPPERPNETRLSSPFLTDHRLDLVISKIGALDDLVQEDIKKALTPVLNLIHLSNGAHNVLTRAANLSAESIKEAHGALLSVIGSNASELSIKRAESILESSGVYRVEVQPQGRFVREWVEHAMLFAMEEKTSPPPYNRLITEDVLDAFNEHALSIFDKIPHSTKQARTNFSEIVSNAKLEVKSYHLIKDILSSFDKTPIATRLPVVNYREYETQATLFGLEYTPIDYQDVILPLVQGGNLPDDVSSSLYAAMQRDFDPLPDVPLAKSIFQQVRKEFYEAPSIIGHKSILNGLGKTFKVAAVNPLNDVLTRPENTIDWGEAPSPNHEHLKPNQKTR